MSKSKDDKQGKPRKKRRWLRRFFLLVVLCGVLLVGAYFFLTSSIFFNSMVVPRIETELGRGVEISSYSFSPFGKLQLKDVVFAAKEGESEPALKLADVDIRFDLMSLLTDLIRVTRVHVTGLDVRVNRLADGTLTGPFPPMSEKADSPDKSTDKPGAPAKLIAVSDVKIRDVGVTYNDYYGVDNNPRKVLLSEVNITAEQLRLDQPSRLDGSLMMAVHNPRGTSAEGRVSGKIDLALNIEPDAENPPKNLKADVKFTQLQGNLGDQQYDDLAAEFTIEATRDGASRFVLETLNLTMKRANQAAGAMNASGEWDIEKSSGRMQAEIEAIDSQLLNLIGATRGYSFNDTELSGRLRAVIADGMRVESLDLSGKASNLSVKGPDFSDAGVPPMNINILARLSSDPAKPDVLQVSELESRVSHVGGKNIATLRLNQSFDLDAKTYLPKAETVSDEALQLNLNDLSVPLWAALMPQGTGVNFSEGSISADLVLGKADTQQPTARLSGKLTASGIKGRVDAEAFGPLSVDGNLLALATESGRVQVQDTEIRLRSNQSDLGTIILQADIDTKTMKGNANLNVNALDFLNVPFAAMADLRKQVRRGRVSSDVNITLSDGGKQVDTDTTTRIPDLVLRPTPGQEGADLSLPFQIETLQTVRLDTQDITIQKMEARVGSGNEQGVLTATGQVNYGKSPGGKIDFTARSFRSGPFEPLLADSLNGMRLGPVVISGDGSVAFSQKNGLDNADVNLELAGLQPSGGALSDGLPMPINVKTRLKAAALQDSPGFRVSTLQVTATRGDNGGVLASANLLSTLDIKAPDYVPDMKQLPERLLEVNIPDLNLLEWRGFIPADSGLNLNAGRFQADITVGRSTKMNNALVANVTSKLTSLSGELNKQPFGPLSVITNADADADATGAAKINTAKIELLSGQTPLGAISLSGNMSKDKADITANVESLQLDRMPVGQLREAMRDVSRAVLSADLRFARDAGIADVNGTLSVSPFVMKAGEGASAKLQLPIRAELRNTYNERDKTLKVERFDVALGENRSAGSLTLTGNYSNGNHPGGQFYMQIKDLRLAAFTPLLGSLRENVDLRNASLVGTQSLTISGEKGQRISAKGNLRLTGLRPAAKPAAPEMIVRLDNDLQRNEQRVDVRQAVVSINHSNNAIETINVQPGVINLAQAADQGVLIQSESLTLPPLLLYASIESDPDVEPLKVNKLETRVAGNEGGLKLSEMTFGLGNGKITGESVLLNAADSEKPPVEWTNIQGAGLDIDHLLATVKPDKRGYLLGTAAFSTTGYYRGEKRKRDQTPAGGELIARVTDGEILNVPIVNAIAEATQLQELRKVIFQRFDSRYVARRDGIHLDKCIIIGEPQKIQASGKIGWDKSVDIPIQLALGGKLKEKVQDRSYSRYLREDSDGYLKYPTPLGVGGTLLKPKVKLTFPTQSLLDIGIGILEDELKEDDD